MRLLSICCGLLWVTLFAGDARAHLLPNSAIYLDFSGDSVSAEIVIPAGELAYAAGKGAGPGTYLLRHFGAATLAGQPWAIRLLNVRRSADISVHLEMIPPPGASPRIFMLRHDAIIDRVPNHFALVFARSDYRGGILSSEPEMIGGLQGAGATMLVDRGEGSGWHGFAAAVRLGIKHISEGHDHLLFLIALILPAPLLAQGRRWGRYGGVRHMMRGLVAVVTAFTVGHSLTLIGGAFFGWRLPVQPVEILIALSILVSAIHAWRPLFAGHETWVAAGFGLVHGLAFATLIGNFGLEPLQKAQAILGFNLGIEIVQLAVIASLMPALLLFARTEAYQPLRRAGALCAGIAALAWMIERIAGTRNMVGEGIDRGLAHAPWLLAAITVAALLTSLKPRLSRAWAAGS